MRKAIYGVMAGMWLLAAACGSGGGDKADSSTTTASTVRETAPTTTVETTAATEAPPTTSAAPVLMPAIACGTDLQVAQDRVQAAGVFYSRSEDATGENRHQVIDSNWTVVRQSPPAGTPIKEGDPVFFVVKDEEFTGC